MEDRHYLNDPRPIPGLTLPTWEVDIMREGVDTPILTLRVDSESLPPRRGKKKKIVWKLPDDVNQIPKFGMEDKKRIFELYKEEKKRRRLMRKNSATTTSMEDAANGVKEDQPLDPPQKNGKLEKAGSFIDHHKEEKVDAPTKTQQPPAPSPPAPNKNPNQGGGSAPPGFQGLSISDSKESVNSQDRNNAKNQNGSNQVPATPPKPTASPSSRQEPSPTQPPGLAAPTQQQQAPTPPAPPGMSSPPPLRNNKILVPPGTALASVVAELYYGLLTRGLISELLPYYTSTAQKSLTVGGAHAVCGPTLAEKELQLKHLVGMVVAIKGVLQQPTTGSGVLVLITGMCVRPHALPFCHSLVLVPVENGFQIQNDALCFLTAETAVPSEPASNGNAAS